MKTTVAELFDKINDIVYVQKQLDELATHVDPPFDTVIDQAIDHLEDYRNIILKTKIEV